jgi:lysophospholipid acyltransferase (LPLAT)-like uncharacterized protein
MAEAGERRVGWLERVWLRLASAAIWLLSLTLRVRIEGVERLEQVLRSGRAAVITGWHACILLGIRPLRRYRPVIMVSQSRDGERITRVVERLGWSAVRGSSSRGGARALATLIRELRRGRVVVHIVDGPRGPARVVKPGLVKLAERSGAPIFPTVASARWRWEAPSWDRMQVPLPFSRATVRFLAPIEVPLGLPPHQAEAVRKDIETRLVSEFEALERELRG